MKHLRSKLEYLKDRLNPMELNKKADNSVLGETARNNVPADGTGE